MLHKQSYRHTSKIILLLCVLTLAVFGAVTSFLSYRASTTSETLCVAVTVIGMDGGDPGEAICDPSPVPESSSSSSSSSSVSSFTSSQTSSELSGSSTSAQNDNTGTTRYSLERSRYKVIELLRLWSIRNTLHAAPNSVCRVPYEDYFEDVWFSDAVADFYCEGILDHALLFRPAESSNRAEMVALLVRATYAEKVITKEESFNDVPSYAWFFHYIETVADAGWMKGYDNCYGSTPCYARPAANITRAEAAAMVLRAFEITTTDSVVQSFADVSPHAWYVDTIAQAASACILRGDADTGYMRPDQHVTRAEIVTMIWRARSGNTCDKRSSMEFFSTQEHFVNNQQFISAREVIIASIDGGMQSSFKLPLCREPTFMCVAQVVGIDFVSWITPFGGVLLWPSLSVIQSASASELSAWSLMCCLLLFISISITRFLKHTTNSR